MSTNSAELPSDSNRTVAFSFYPQYGGIVTGEPTRRSWSFGVAVALVLLFTLLTSSFVFVTLPNWRNALELANHGQIAAAQIESHRTAADREGNTSYYVSYSFRAGDMESVYSREQRVSRATYEQTTDGAPVDVRYLPSHAERSTLAGDRTEYRTRTITVAINAAAALAVLISLIAAFAGRQRQAAPANHGSPCWPGCAGVSSLAAIWVGYRRERDDLDGLL